MRAISKSKPVVLYLARNLVVGGAERVVINVANHAQTVSPVVALLERSGGLLGELRPDVPCLSRVDPARATSRFATIGADIPGESFARLALECLWLKDVVTQTGARLVSSFLMRAHVVALVTKIALLPRLPLVLNIHEHMTESAPFLYPRARDRVLMRWITRHLFPRADRVIVVAEELERDLVTQFGVPAKMIDVVLNGHDIARLRAAAAEPLEPPWMRQRGSAGRASTESHTVVAVGRLVHLKGYDLLMHALVKLRQTRDVRLILVGDGEQRAELERLATQLGLHDIVMFAGEQENPWRFVARADLVALTSRTEAFPSVLVEAMALGVPVLATASSAGVRECLRDGACGLIVPAGDIDAIAAGIDRLLGNAELRASLVAEGLARAASFDLLTAQRRYESVLTEVIDSRST